MQKLKVNAYYISVIIKIIEVCIRKEEVNKALALGTSIQHQQIDSRALERSLQRVK